MIESRLSSLKYWIEVIDSPKPTYGIISDIV